MENNFKNSDAIVEFQKIIEFAEEFQAEIDEYCDFMKQTFLATSGLN